MSTEKSDVAATEKPKTKFDTLLTSTPVILTVLSTLLAGLSSSEMTKAQYHRALAAQNQSKAGDQWALFQAKRIRGTNMDTTADMLSAFAEPIVLEQTALQADCTRLLVDLRQGAAAARAFAAALGTGGNDEGLRRASEQLVQSADAATRQAETTEKKLAQAFSIDRGVFEQFAGNRLPKVEDSPIADESIQQALKAVEEQQPEQQTDSLMRGITSDGLLAAIKTAEGNAAHFDTATEKITKPVDDLGRVIREEVDAAQRYVRQADRLGLALRSAEVGEPVHKAGAAVSRAADSIRQEARSLNTDVTAARNRFNAIRYRKEAGYNRTIAGLYEVQVRKSSWDSERHRYRSGLFFYGMLAAQAGVTIATLALAVRFRSVLWGIASLAGAAAIAIAVWVYALV